MERWDFRTNTEYYREAMRHLKHPASDDMTIEWEAVKEIESRLDLARGSKIPSDLIFSGHIPILDLTVTLLGEGELQVNGGKVVSVNKQKVRFCFYPHKEIKGEMSVGFVAFPAEGGYMTADVCVKDGDDYLSWGGLGYAKNGRFQFAEEYTEDSEVVRKATMEVGSWLWIWYIVQIALLHPQIRKSMPSPKREAVKRKAGKRKQKRATTYIKKHYIKAGNVEDAIGNSRMVRKTLAWYVIGHWRHYKNGHKVFIKGYWKGALREMKQNLDEGRKRGLKVG